MDLSDFSICNIMFLGFWYWISYIQVVYIYSEYRFKAYEFIFIFKVYKRIYCGDGFSAC